MKLPYEKPLEYIGNFKLFRRDKLGNNGEPDGRPKLKIIAYDSENSKDYYNLIIQENCNMVIAIFKNKTIDGLTLDLMRSFGFRPVHCVVVSDTENDPTIFDHVEFYSKENPESTTYRESEILALLEAFDNSEIDDYLMI